MNPTKNDTRHPRAKEKSQKDGRRDKIAFRLKPHTCQRYSEDSNKPVRTRTQRPHRDLDRIMFECLLWRYGSAVDCCRGRGSGCSRPGRKPTWRRSPLIPPQSRQNLHRTRETDSWRAQTKAWVHQDPGERSSDPTRD